MYPASQGRDEFIEDGTFKSFEELKTLYAAEGVDGGKPVITYCRIGERSSHSWFGSWTEWGKLVGMPIERGSAAAAGKAA